MNTGSEQIKVSGDLKRWKVVLPRSKTRRRMNCSAAAKIVRLMLGAKPTMHDMVDATGLCIHTVRAYVKAMHVANACHVAGWELDDRGAYMTPRWALGAMPDVAKPTPISPALRAKAYRLRKTLIAKGKPAPPAAVLARQFEE